MACCINLIAAIAAAITGGCQVMLVMLTLLLVQPCIAALKGMQCLSDAFRFLHTLIVT